MGLSASLAPKVCARPGPGSLSHPYLRTCSLVSALASALLRPAHAESAPAAHSSFVYAYEAGLVKSGIEYIADQVSACNSYLQAHPHEKGFCVVCAQLFVSQCEDIIFHMKRRVFNQQAGSSGENDEEEGSFLHASYGVDRLAVWLASPRLR